MKRQDMYRRVSWAYRLAFIAVSVFVVVAATGFSGAFAQGTPDAAASAKAFLAATKVFFHPRCVNCHPAGNSPLQGDDSHRHGANVKRGPEGLGVAGIRCSVCHQASNQPGPHMPPGAPGWKLPPDNAHMTFEKRTPKQLCLQLKDPKQNGNLSVKEVVEHVKDAPLVLWGWSPGEGRTPVPVSHDEFVKLMVEWADKGAYCPE